MRRFSILLLALLALSAAACAPEPPAREEPRHVFLITVDTLRADRLGSYGYPRATSPVADALAAEGALFEQAVAQWPKTGPSFVSMFTGRYPLTTGVTHDAAVRVPEGYFTLPELFQELGFTTVAVISNGVLNRELGWDVGFDEYLETWHLPEGQSEDPVLYRRSLNAPRVNELALPLLDRHRDTERLFAWIHYSDPHAPYVVPDGFENPFVGDPHYVGDDEVFLENPPAMALGDRRDLKHYIAAYDANVLVSDLHIGQLLERARRLGMLEDALVLFTSDHGESLGEHDYYFHHGRLPYNTTSMVPLILHAPGRFPAGTRVQRPVELLDLYPTLLEIFAPDRPVPGLEGESLLPYLEGREPVSRETPALAFSQAGGGTPLTHFRMVQDERWKLIYHPPTENRRGETVSASWELYDLATDPGETLDLKEAEHRELRRLRRDLFDWMDGREWIRLRRSDIDSAGEEVQRALRALGYL